MRLSELSVGVLKEIAARRPIQNLHPEDKAVYDQGLRDGNQVLAEWVLSELQPDNPNVVEEGLTETENNA